MKDNNKEDTPSKPTGVCANGGKIPPLPVTKPPGFLKQIGKEAWIILALLVALLAAPSLLRLVDNSVGGIDIGELQILVMASLKILMAVAITWLVVVLFFPTLAKHASLGEFKDDWLELEPSTRALALLATVLIIFAVVTIGLIMAADSGFSSLPIP